MANVSALHAPGTIPVPRTSPLAGQKSNPWFNVLAAVVVITGIIYTGYHLADDLSVVRDTRPVPYILPGITLLIAGVRVRQWLP